MKLLKIVFVSVVLTLFGSFYGFAQSDGFWYGTGYRVNVEVEAGSTLSRFFIGSVLTSHGYNVGNGLYCGVGTGVTANPNEYGNFTIPVFADLKYSFMNKDFSPFVAIKMGTSFYVEDLTAGLMCRPSVGVDIRKCSLSMGYGRYTGTETSISVTSQISKEFTKHSLVVAAAWWL